MKKLPNVKVAIVCDWLTNYAGAERVISAIAEVFENAPIYTTVYNKAAMREFKEKNVKQTFISKLPFAKKKHQLYITLMPYAFESMDLSDYDLVISSSHACAKGIITNPDTVHVCYCHSQVRYLWDGCHDYVKNYGWYRWPFKFCIDRMLSKLRTWDRIAAERVDHYVANSHFVAKRIKKYYGRDSKVIHPPVDIESFEIGKVPREYYLAVGRLIPYKRFDILVDAFNRLGLPLYIVGQGKEFAELKSRAKDNVTMLGFVSESKLKTLYAGAKALLFPQEEDFGITPLEAMASGTPVIAYGAGGALETVVDKKTGLYFESQTVTDVINAVKQFEEGKVTFDPKVIRKHAETFSKEAFKKNLISYIEEVLGSKS